MFWCKVTFNFLYFQFIFYCHLGLPLQYRVTNNSYTNTLTQITALTRLQDICLIAIDDIHNIT